MASRTEVTGDIPEASDDSNQPSMPKND